MVKTWAQLYDRLGDSYYLKQKNHVSFLKMRMELSHL